ncbi:MAG: DUF929 family protein [Candidatus Aenigmarchaeota archaeon]|nr:DUF929 family protein [Candidatus Aenigmarchaeota archaeon]
MKNKIVIAAVVVVIVTVIVGLILLNPSKPVTGQAIESTEKELTAPVKTLGNYFQYSNQPANSDGKVRVLFVGGEFCPFCAAQRWPLVESLKKFGELGELKGTTSAEIKDMPSNLATFHLIGVDYTSGYVRFDHKEIQDRDFNELEKLTTEEQEVFNKYNPKGSIPFLMISGKKGVYVQISSGYSPGTLSGLSFFEIQEDLKNNPDAKEAISINNEADVITAIICYNSKNKAPACSTEKVQSLVSKL